MRHYLNMLRRYADFRGRSSREEYLWSGVFNLLFAILAAGIDFSYYLLTGTFDYPYFLAAYVVATMCPQIALGVRRMHDIGKSGWGLFIGGLALYAKGQTGANQYGPEPNGLEASRNQLVK